MKNSTGGLPPLAAPARRALTNAGIRDLNDLAAKTEQEVQSLHGIGPNALKQLKAALDSHGLSFVPHR